MYELPRSDDEFYAQMRSGDAENRYIALHYIRTQGEKAAHFAPCLLAIVESVNPTGLLWIELWRALDAIGYDATELLRGWLNSADVAKRYKALCRIKFKQTSEFAPYILASVNDPDDDISILASTLAIRVHSGTEQGFHLVRSFFQTSRHASVRRMVTELMLESPWALREDQLAASGFLRQLMDDASDEDSQFELAGMLLHEMAAPEDQSAALRLLEQLDERRQCRDAATRGSEREAL